MSGARKPLSGDALAEFVRAAHHVELGADDAERLGNVLGGTGAMFDAVAGMERFDAEPSALAKVLRGGGTGT